MDAYERSEEEVSVGSIERNEGGKREGGVGVRGNGQSIYKEYYNLTDNGNTSKSANDFFTAEAAIL